MNEQIKILVNMLKAKVNYNRQIIKDNEETIKGLLLQPISHERTILLKENFNINKKLLEENHDSLVVELQLVKYLGKLKEVFKYQANNNQPSNEVSHDIDSLANENYQDVNRTEQPESNSDSELLRSTIAGKIPFNPEHPRFNDEAFYNNLFDGYKQVENYEMCSILLKMKGKK